MEQVILSDLFEFITPTIVGTLSVTLDGNVIAVECTYNYGRAVLLVN